VTPSYRWDATTRALENLRKRKATGGRTQKARGRRAYERDSYPLEPVVGPLVRRFSRTRGGGVSVGLSSVDSANVADPAAGKVVRTRIIRVKSSPANRDYGRRGVITKGATIETELGEAKVVSRPSDDGAVNAVLVKQR